MHRRNTRAPCAGLAAVLALSLSGTGWAQEKAPDPAVAAKVGAAALDRRVVVDLPEQPLSAAVIELTKQAGVQLVMPGRPLHDQITPGLHGEMSLREALTRLLKDTGANFHETSPGTIAIEVPRRGSAEEGGSGDLALEGHEIATTEVTAIAVPELASAAGGAPAPQEDAEGVQRLEEIVVTSTKRAQSVREIPATVIGLSGEDLERANVKGFEDLARLVPGVNVTTPSEGTPRITIRGIASQATTNATTGLLYGDIGFTDTYLPRVVPDPLPFDLQSVEVLKGPQGTLFGAGSLNGAIRYIPEPAKLGTWEAKYMAEYTQVSQGGAAPVLGAVVNMPIGEGEKAALRLTGYQRNAPGYLDNSQLGEDGNKLEQTGVRGSLVLQPSETVNGTLTYAWQESASDDNAVADNVDGELKTDNRPERSPQVLRYGFADFKLGVDFEGMQLISDTGFVRKSGDTYFDASSRLTSSMRTPLRAAQVDQANSGTWSQEVRLVSTDDGDARWRWVAGASAFKQDVALHLQLPVFLTLPGGLGAVPQALGSLLGAIPGLRNELDANGSAMLALLDTDAAIKEYALFGDITRRLGERWELSLGGRLYQTTSAGTVRQAGLLLLAINREPVHYLTGEIRERGFNPKASILWRYSRDLIAYGAVSKGFRVGGVQPGYSFSRLRAPDFFKSDTLWNYEAGLRTQWFDRSLRADMTAFYATWDNPQTFQLATGGLSSYIDNAGGVKNQGVEAALQAVLPWGFQLSVSGCWTDTRTSKPFESQGGRIAPGAQWPNAPHWQTSTSLAWLAPLGSWVFSSGASYSTIGSAPSALDAKSARSIFGYQQVDLQLGLANPSMAWVPEFGLTLNNALDERGLTNHYDGGLVPGISYTDASYIRPRTLTLRVAGRF